MSFSLLRRATLQRNPIASSSRLLSSSPTHLRARPSSPPTSASAPSPRRASTPPLPQPHPLSHREPSHPKPWDRPEPPLVAAARAKTVKQRNVWESYLVLDPKSRLYFSLGLMAFALIGFTSACQRLPLIFPTEILSQIITIAATSSLHPSTILFTKNHRADLLSFAYVSDDWHKCSRAILYGSIIRKWDSCMKLLTRTFTERPHICASFKTFETFYPTLGSWPDKEARQWEKEELASLQEARVRAGPPYDVPNDAQLKGQAVANAFRRWSTLARDMGAADWMDPGESYRATRGPQPRRRKGAIALVEFLASCQSLKSVTIHGFDFGNSDEGEESVHVDDVEDYALLKARLPLSSTTASSVESLCMSSADWKIRRIFLKRTPNLQNLELGWISKDPIIYSNPMSFNFLHLRRLDIGPITRSGAATAGAILALSTSALRFLSISSAFPAVEPLIAPFLPTLPLETLVISRTDIVQSKEEGNWSLLIPTQMSDYLSTSTIQHLALPYLATPRLLESLPTSLQSLETIWFDPAPSPPPGQAKLKVVLKSVLEASRRNLNRLERFTLAGALTADYSGGSRDGVVYLVEPEISDAVAMARLAGIDLILTDERRFAF
ncbi:hypothetical protein P7C70_g1895, partial [Phenoliferia sp. Uapishka_3]